MRLLFPAGLLLASAAALTLAGPHALAQSVAASPATVPFVKSEARAVVAKLADALERDYLLPEAGRAYAAALRSKLAAGGYDSFPDSPSFTKAVTADLQAVHPDAHLALLLPAVKEGSERQSAAVYPTYSTILAKGCWRRAPPTSVSRHSSPTRQR